MTQTNDRAKRAFDVAIVDPLLVLTLPIKAATAPAVRIRLGSPILFKQTRHPIDAGKTVMGVPAR